MRTPVSWFLVEAGWKVTDRGGEEVGTVEEVIGEEERDIFTGLAVATKLLGKARYVPAERVANIYEGLVELDLSADEVSQLGDAA
jgi:hypothetical protein